jgi:hypothetical protein
MKMTPKIFLGGSILVWAASISIMVVFPVVSIENKPSEIWRPMTLKEQEGLRLYVNNGCSYCHSQYIRKMDWGIGAERIAQPGDYYDQEPAILGSERTGPDLSQEGGEHPDDWHKAHFINPRFTRPVSVMPSWKFLGDDKIDKLLYHPNVVSLTLIIYGIIFIFLESKNNKPKISDLSQITYKFALLIGVFQMLALIPGTSRSGATIVGAIFLGTSRYIATEFSFFLSIPIMLGASGLKLLKAGLSFSGLEITVLLVGSITAFIVSIFAIKFLLNYIKKHDFKIFGYYRIILGILIILYFGLKWLI